VPSSLFKGHETETWDALSSLLAEISSE